MARKLSSPLFQVVPVQLVSRDVYVLAGFELVLQVVNVLVRVARNRVLVIVPPQMDRNVVKQPWPHHVEGTDGKMRSVG